MIDRTATTQNMLPFDLAKPVQERFTAFIKTLRANGFEVGLRESSDAQKILCAIDLTNKGLLLMALRALIASRRDDWNKFERVFNAFWFGHGTKGPTRLEDRRQSAPCTARESPYEKGPQRSGTGDRTELHSETPERTSGDTGMAQEGGASVTETLKRKDFRHINNHEELKQAYALADRLATRMRMRFTRRQKTAKHGCKIDFRHTIHHSIARGGTPIELVFRRRRKKPLRLIMLLDTSGSMASYTVLFVRFMHGMLGAFRSASAFLFHTRLVDVTGPMTDKDPQRAIDRFSLMTEGVGGGTRIGESLAIFNAKYSSLVRRSKTAVIIVSDGYETDDPQRLSKEMQTLSKHCRRIVWLNPMAGWQDYLPEAQGMKAALPFIDFFAPAHSLKSLEALGPYFARL